MLIDSDVLIWYLRGYPRAAQKLDSLGEFKLSAVSYMEVAQGCRNQQELGLFKADLRRRNGSQLPVTQPISDRAVSLIEAHALSDGLKLADALIAATAIECGLTLLTGNMRHFLRVAGLSSEVFEP